MLKPVALQPSTSRRNSSLLHPPGAPHSSRPLPTHSRSPCSFSLISGAWQSSVLAAAQEQLEVILARCPPHTPPSVHWEVALFCFKAQPESDHFLPRTFHTLATAVASKPPPPLTWILPEACFPTTSAGHSCLRDLGGTHVRHCHSLAPVPSNFRVRAEMPPTRPGNPAQLAALLPVLWPSWTAGCAVSAKHRPALIPLPVLLPQGEKFPHQCAWLPLTPCITAAPALALEGPSSGSLAMCEHWFALHALCSGRQASYSQRLDLLGSWLYLQHQERKRCDVVRW